MKLFWPSLALCAASTLLTGAATAAVSQQRADASTVKPATARTATAATEQPPQNPLQALCREIFVNVDEGYGVTGKETRTICDEPR